MLFLSITLIMLSNIKCVLAQSENTITDCSQQIDDLTKRLDDAKLRLEDWSKLSRYRDENETLLPPAKDEFRVVFMGDSITEQWYRDFPSLFFPGKPYINRGIGGQTSPQMLIRFRSDVIDLKPKVVVILAGTNDIAGNTGPMTLKAIQNNLVSMAELAQANNIRVVLASLLPVNDYKRMRTDVRSPEKIVALNIWIKDYATKNGHIYLNYYAALLDNKGMLKDELSNDGLHVNEKGYAIMQPLAEEAIKAALKKR
jgi:lysophospholipase L1-like esterase